MAVNEESSIPEKTALPLESADLNAMIAELAYYKAESRGFAPGHEMEDWLEAERELTGGGE